MAVKVAGGYKAFNVALSDAVSSLIFLDDFESYVVGSGATNSNANFSWDGTARLVSDAESFSGTKSLTFGFDGDPNLAAQADVPQYFTIVPLKPRLTIEYRIFIPANYFHRDSTGADNNKFLRLWPVNYTDVEKVGFSTQRQGVNGDSSLLVEFSNVDATSAAMAAQSTIPDFITAADRGAWMLVKIEVIAATATTDGTLRFYKNGSLFAERTDVPSRGYSELGYGKGYLMGYANSGYTDDTVFYIDDFEIYSGVL